jgi:CSLREA domain-containing protein
MNARIIRTLLGIPIALAVAVVLLVLARPPVTTALFAPGVITVNTTTDEYDVVPNNTCSLREAIQTANAGANFGGCVRVSIRTIDTILLPSGIYTLTRTGTPEDLNVTGDLDIRGTVIINAMGATPPVVTEDSNLRERLFDIVTGKVTINGVTITGGSESSQPGGGARVAAGASLLLNQVSLVNNAAHSGGGVYSFGTLTITQSTLTGNSAQGGSGIFNPGLGGGIYNGSMAALSNSTISGNSAYWGGGIFNNDTATLSDVTSYSNTAAAGGSIYHFGATGSSFISLENSMLANSPSGGNCGTFQFGGR